MPGRTLVVGDIHGCLDEFTALLDEVGYRHGRDRLILLGDLVNRGPNSHGVLRLAQDLGAECVIGNHERRLLRYRDTGEESVLKSYDRDTIDNLEEADWRFMAAFLPWVEIPRHEAVCVHAGFLPGVPWRTQGPEIFTRIQVIDSQGRPAKRGDAPASPLWAWRWRGPPFVVYGHTPQPEVERNPWSLGLDTGCVYGGKLTAALLPERRIIQIQARRNYTGKRMALTRRAG